MSKHAGFLHNVLNKYLYGRHPVVFAFQQTIFVQSKLTQVYFIQLNRPHTYATCFDLYLGHRQACQYKEHTREDITKIQGPLDFYYIFYIHVPCAGMPEDGVLTDRNM